jgi:hypothetical protein
MMRTGNDDRWRGAVALGVCGGLSYYLTTGEGANGLGLGLFMTALLLLLVLFFPPSRRWRRASDFYVMASIVLVLPWVLLKVGYTGRSGRGDRPAWHDLQARYPATGPAPADLDGGRDVSVRRVRSYTYRNYSFKGIRASFSDAGVYLAHSFPLSLAYSPVQVPVNGIWRCQKDASALSNTTLSVRDLDIEVHMADVDGHILEWCGRHEIPENVPEKRR